MHFIPIDRVENTGGSPITACTVHATAIRGHVHNARSADDLEWLMSKVLGPREFIKVIRDFGYLVNVP